ncbi:hypothetical protein DMB42_35420 [Nonomuraea sp. WAC 01424]|uniref:hypothetical protein n=1 Tax=Nonomuraea sp. WAC 01424 TaxID=2203200 RepID=UPI000F7A25C6|nr:hypothetical protein [Nonomuraea sp. WAC 01424]RSN03169.1 hypothetical protein DMB42_35420 [Nonomuraea sp. WAC 01424]
MNTEGATRRAWIVLGGIHLLNQTVSRRPHDPIVLVRVAPQEVSVPSTTVVVQWAALGDCPASALTAAGATLANRYVVPGSALFPDSIAGPALRAMVGEAAAPGLVPLCYLAEHHDGYHVYAQIGFYAEDACFLRITNEPIGAGPVEALHWLEPALAEHAASALRLNNHKRYFHTHFAGTELEFKYNLTPGTDIWATAMELLTALRHGALDGCRPEYRDELQTYFTENHLFDVVGPEEELGYASFVRAADGGHVLKRKWYAEDTFARREQLSPNVQVPPGGFEEHLREEMGLQVQAMPPFRRVRYDVQCESMATGHIYGIFLDHCSILAAPDVVLSQCEVEYRRSRSLLDRDQDTVLAEMDRIGGWLQDYLAARGLAQVRTYYSKRTFLRDAVAARPDLGASR